MHSWGRIVVILLTGCICLSVSHAFAETCVQVQIPKLLKQTKLLGWSARKKALVRGLHQRCKKLPQAIRTLLQTDSGKPHKLIPALRKVLEQYWTRACPGISLKKLRQLKPDKRRKISTYKHCKGAGTRLMSAKEAKGIDGFGGDFMISASLQQWLLEEGVSQRDARAFVRASLMRATVQGVLLLPSKASLLLQHMSTVALRSGGLLVNGFRCCKSPNQALVLSKLLPQLKTVVRRRKMIARLNKAIPFRGRLLLFIDPEIPYHLLKKVMSTAFGAGLTQLYFGLGQEKVPFVGQIRMLPFKLQCQKRSPNSSHLVVRLTQARTTIQEEGKAPTRGCVGPEKKQGVQGGYDQGTLRRFGSCLREMKSRFPNKNEARWLVGPKVTFRQLVQAINTSQKDISGKALFPGIALAFGASKKQCWWRHAKGKR